jgi:intracellular sulfur oxidation DsrE/DsrF family protein
VIVFIRKIRTRSDLLNNDATDHAVGSSSQEAAEVKMSSPKSATTDPGGIAMTRYKLFTSLCAVWFFIAIGPLHAQETSEPALHIDVPTQLDKANVVIDFGHAVYNGDMPFALGDTNLLASDVRDWNAKGQIVVIFHGDAAYMILNDEAYNANRHVSTGNPYKKILSGLQDKGVQLELCGATAKGNHWGNANLLPGVKVNVNAMVRLTQLEQEGYTMIYQ